MWTKSNSQGIIITKTIDFLADSGSQISIIPRRLIPAAIFKQCKQTTMCFQAYNGSPIKVYGSITGDVVLGTTTLHACQFYVTDDFTPILGSADLFRFGFFGIHSDKSTMYINGSWVDVDIVKGGPASITVVQPSPKENNSSAGYSLSADEDIKVGPECETVISLRAPTNVPGGVYVSHLGRLNDKIVVGGVVNQISDIRISDSRYPRITLPWYTFQF